MHMVSSSSLFFGVFGILISISGGVNAGSLSSLFSDIFASENPSTIARRSAREISPQVYYGQSEVPAWRGRLDTVYDKSYFAPAIYQNKCNPDRQDCSLISGASYPCEQYEIDPTGSGRPVMRVTYPAGSWSPGSVKPGGTLFYAYPYKSSPSSAANPFSRQTAYLEYEVYFPPDFDFVKGGKLPGLSGGKSEGRGCGGGANPDECFSCRVMWRRDGAGEVYIYAPEGEQGPDFCDPRCSTGVQPCTVCNYNAGVSFKRYAFYFPRGEWTRLRLGVTLNTMGQNDGNVTLEVNGEKIIEYTKMKWRLLEDVFIEGINFSSWFGGGDSSWAPDSDMYILLRNFRAFYDGPVTPMNQVAKLSAPTGNYGPNAAIAQVLEEGYVDEP